MNSLSGSSCLCRIDISVMNVFLWAMLLMKWLTNFSPKSLKVLIDLGGNEENQDLAAFFRVAGKALHMMASPAPCMDMLVQNISKWSMGSAVLSYDSMLGRLKHLCKMDSSTLCVNGEFPSIFKFTYAPPIVTHFSINPSSLACLPIFYLSLWVLFPWSAYLLGSLFLSRLTSNLRLKSMLDLSSSTSCVPSSYIGRTLLEMRWLGIKDSSKESWELEVCWRSHVSSLASAFLASGQVFIVRSLVVLGQA